MKTPLPIPAGWYALGPEAGLHAGQARTQRFCGRTVQVSREPEGQVRVTEGARDLPMLVRGGMLMAWFHPDDAHPAWEIGALDDGGWSSPSFVRQELRMHPLHVMRDLADLVHFETVHRYKDIDVRQPLVAHGPRLETAIAFGWDTGLPGVERGLPASFESRVEGPGYQLTEVLVPAGQWVSRHLVLPTPLGDGRCALHLAVSVRLTGVLGLLEASLGGWAMRPLRGLIHAFVARMFVRDIARDAGMWVNLEPVLEVGPPEDPHFAVFQKWQQQFLPSLPVARAAG